MRRRGACVRGEGEETVLELADECTTRGNWHGIGGLSWRDGEDLVRNEPRPLITDLDVLPFPARDHLPEVLRRGGGVVISGSRGCWGQCSFCSIREFYGARGEERWRGRSPRNVVEEMKLLHATYGADRYWFVDDEFFCAGSRGRQRAEAIFQQVIEEGLAVRFDIFCRAEDFAVGRRDGVLDLGVRAGLRRALIGIESGSAKVLKRYRKGLSPAVNRKAVVEGEALGIDVRVEFIMLDPWSTLSEVEANLAFLRQLPSATGIGKADPVILSSKLYIHRETDLGRRFLAEMCLPVESPPTATTKYPVPYEFRDPRVVALDHIISHAWGHFAPVLQVLERLDRLVDRLSVPPLLEKSEFDRRKEVAREHEVRRRGLQRVLDEQALAFFEEALAFVRHFDLKGRTQEERDARQDALDDEVYGVSRRMAFEAENVATYVYSLAVPALGAAWDALCHLGLQYDGERPPDELGALV
jgi:hypothetical protein